MNRPVKAGVISSGIYVAALIMLIILAAIEQSTAHGEHNYSGWALLVLAAPGLLLRNGVLGANAGMPIPAAIWILNPALVFGLGAAIAAIVSALRRRSSN